MAKFIPKRQHLSLSNKMFSRVAAADFPKSVIRYQNSAWADRLGLEAWLEDDQKWCDHFARFQPIEGSMEAPLALAYHGHQFGVYNPDLGDGRGFLYAQMLDPENSRLLDFGTERFWPNAIFADGRWKADPQRGYARNSSHRNAGCAWGEYIQDILDH